MNNIKVGVIGCGHLGQHHARIMSEMDGVSLVGVVDIDFNKAEEIALRYNTKPYPDYRSLCGQVDAAIVAAPTSLHFEIGNFLLENDIDLLVEKPICRTLEDATKMLEAAEKRGKILQVGHLEQFNSGVIALKNRVKHAMFIESHRIGPFVPRGTDVDVILDLMIHDIDIILSLVQSEAEHIHATGVPIISPQIDIANAQIHFKSGCVANITASRASMEQVRKIRVFQPHNYLSLNYKEQTLLSRYLKNDKGAEYPEVFSEQVEIVKSEPLRDELAAFVNSVRMRSKPIVSGWEGREALRVALMVTSEIKAGLKQFGYDGRMVSVASHS